MSAKPGTKPAPVALKVVRGDRPSRINRAQPLPQVPDTVPEPPEHLGLGESAKALWVRHAPGLHRDLILTERDLEEFGVWCQAVAFAAEAARELDGTLIGVGQSKKEPVKNPAWQIWKDSVGVILKTGALFGMSPSDRQHIVVPQQVDEDTKTRLLS